MPEYIPEVPKRKRGRPPGSRNGRNRLEMQPVATPPQHTDEHRHALTKLDFKYGDPATLAARNMSLIDHAQQALRHRLTSGFQADGKNVSTMDIKDIVDLCTALDRAAAGMSRVMKAEKEKGDQLSPEETLEKAILKIMGQDTATQRYAIRRLQENLRKLTRHHLSKVDEEPTAAGAIAALVKR